MSEHAPRVSFAEKVYALSKVIHIVKFRNNVAATYNDHQRKRLRLLDDIALLLVTEASSDVAAVSFERCPTEVIFYYAKNRPSTAAERKHILDLIKDIEGQGTADERLEVILSKVLVTCRPKINSRLRKLKNAITKAPAGSRYRRDDPDGQVHLYFKERFEDWYAAFPTAAGFLDNFLSHLDSFAVGNCQPEKLQELIEIAHVTGSYKPVTDVFLSIELGKRMRLLGDYFGAVTRIIKYHDSTQRHGKSKVKIKFVPAPIPPRHRTFFPADFLPILNRYGSENGQSPIDYTALFKTYPSPTKSEDARSRYANPSMQSVTHCVHAECTLAVYLTTLNRAWHHIEIGCSKSSCWLCELYLAQQQPGDTKFHVSNVHGKLQPGWMIPPGGCKVAEKRIRDSVDDDVLEILYRTQNTTRSDSEPREGSDSDNMKAVVKRTEKPSWLA